MVPALRRAGARRPGRRRDATGSLSAATRSEAAPAGGPGTAPAPPDTKRPKLELLAPKRITVTRKTTSISFKVRCDEPCTLQAFGNMRTVRGKKRVVSPLTTFTTKKAVSGKQTVRLKLSRSTQNDLRKALSARRGAQVFLDITATDAAGNTSRVRGQITLRAVPKAPCAGPSACSCSASGAPSASR